MQLATVSDNTPWISTVYFAADNQFNLIWTSTRNRRHSLDILSNPDTAVTVLKDPNRKQALQIVGKAYEVSDEELEKVHELYINKFGPVNFDLEDLKQRTEDSRSYWIFKPSVISLWDEVNFPDSPKQVFTSL